MATRIYKERNCAECLSRFTPTTGTQRCCATCIPTVNKRYKLAHATQARAKRGSRTRGMTLHCIDCGKGFIFRNGPMERCEPCQAKGDVQTTRRWEKRNPEAARKLARSAHHRFRAKSPMGKALERDGKKCVRCGSTKILHVHHIDCMGKGVPDNERNDAQENLVALCNFCHRRLHVLTEKALQRRHPETVLEVFQEFVHSTCPPQAQTASPEVTILIPKSGSAKV